MLKEEYNRKEDLFKKIMNEKRQSDALKKNQKYFEDNENLKKNIQKSFKLYLKKKRERTREKDKRDRTSSKKTTK